MAATTTTRGRLRRLAELRPEQGRVLSVYFDLDPSEFATGAARAVQVNAILDEAAKLVERHAAELDHEELVGLRKDVERVRREFDPQRMGSGGARGIAVFACSPAGTFEVVRVGHPVEATVRINHAPYLEPLAIAGERERWCVALVSRRDGRIFLGDQDELHEVDGVFDDTHGQHQQGGWSQRRYERSVEEEKRDHIDRLTDRLMTLLRRRPFDRLIIGGPEPIDTEFEARLHPYLKERLAGRIGVDVENSGADDVLAAAAPVFEECRRAHEEELIGRLRAGLGRDGGRATAGLAPTLRALNEQRVEVLLLERNAGARGWVDHETGFMSSEPGESPSGSELSEVDDVIDVAIERAVDQAAEVHVVRDAGDLEGHGGIAALLRF